MTMLNDNIIFEYDVPVPMRDGNTLRANVYRPKQDGRYPVLLNMGPYGKDVSFGQIYPTMWRSMVREHPEILAGGDEDHIKWEVPDPQRWVPDGYVVIHVDTRGTGRSPGKWDPMSVREQQDGADAVDWAGIQPWSNGRVGILGVSYYAVTAWLTASQQPKHLAAIIPFNGWADPYRDFARHGGLVSQFVEHWWNRWLINQHGNPQGRMGVISKELTTGPDVLSSEERAALREDVPQALIDHEMDDDWYRERAVDWNKVNVPFLSIGTWGTVGLHLRGNIDAFRFAASRDKWLALLPGELGRTEDFHKDDGIRMQKSFLARYLKDDPEQPLPESRVVIHAMRPDQGSKRLLCESWPPPQARFTKHYLDFNGNHLTPDIPAADGATVYQAFSQGTALTSAPLENETTIAGPITVKVWVGTEAEDMDIFAELRIVGADGRLINYFNPALVVTSGTTPGMPVARGWLRLSHRALDAEKSTPETPVHAHQALQEVQAGAVYEVDIEIWPTACVVPRGARLSLTLHGEDDPQTELVRHQHPADRTWTRFRGFNTIYSGPSHPSCLLLPHIEA